MKLTTISVAAAAIVVFAQSAQAREHYRHHRYHAAHYARHHSSLGLGDPRYGDYAAQDMFAENARSDFRRNYASQNYSEQSYPRQSAYGGQIGAQIGGRPSAWCGWEMRQLVSGDPGPAFNLARNWAHWGQAGQDRRPRGRRVDHRIRQRRQPDSHPAALHCRRHRHSLGMIGSPDTATLK
jgi:hypothetical protein